MITTIIQFPLTKIMTREEARVIFLESAPRYRAITGLIRKYYLLSESAMTAGGVYLWRSRDDAERFFTADWAAYISKKYGAAPVVTFFDSPVVVDNDLGLIQE